MREQARLTEEDGDTLGYDSVLNLVGSVRGIRSEDVDVEEGERGEEDDLEERVEGDEDSTVY